MTRKLVSIRRVNRIDPIENADFIEKLTVDGWKVIAKKGEFKENDLCVFFEIDSFIPDEPRYEFLKDIKEFNGKKGYRLKTKKLRGVISQGLALPLSSFPEIKNPIQFDEVTELLKVEKYEKIQNSGTSSSPKQQKVGNFPWFIPKTDQERIQNLMEYFETHKETEFEETLKLDGSSLTMYKIPVELNLFKRLVNSLPLPFKFKNYHFGVCSRNLELFENRQMKASFLNTDKSTEFDSNNYWKIAYKYNVEHYLPSGYAIQGEMIGPKIQANHEKVEELDFYVFDIYSIKENRHLTPQERTDFMSVELRGLKHVPVTNRAIKIFKSYPTLDDLLNRVKGPSMNKGTISEGRVYKSIDGKISFKCINNEYLLKCEE